MKASRYLKGQVLVSITRKGEKRVARKRAEVKSVLVRKGSFTSRQGRREEGRKEGRERKEGGKRGGKQRHSPCQDKKAKSASFRDKRTYPSPSAEQGGIEEEDDNPSKIEITNRTQIELAEQFQLLHTLSRFPTAVGCFQSLQVLNGAYRRDKNSNTA